MRKTLLRIAGIAALAVPLVVGGKLLALPAASQPSALSSSNAESPIAQLLNQPSAFLRMLAEPTEMRRFYSARAFQSAWTAPSADNEIAMAVLERAGEEGLDPADYHVTTMAVSPVNGSSGASAERDVLLTDGVIAYIRDMREGRARRGKIGFAVGLPPVTSDPAAELAEALARGDLREFLNGLQPRHRQYAQLKTELAKYTSISRHGDWPSIPNLTDSDLAAHDSRVGLLRERLAAEDMAYSVHASSEVELRAALVRYQRRNHLRAGPLNKETIESLNVPAAVRADQIAANMERWRWFWQAFESRHVEVNSAATTLTAFQNGAPVVNSKIIAGKPRSPTPIFTAKAIAVTVNPSWNIPDAIAKREVLPKARRMSGYLAKEHIVADRPGGRLRQLPGAWNSLGRIKLEMPNRFDTYLHDTNARSLFARQERHLSHGCMRVEQIKPLASFVLTGSSSAAAKKIEEAIGRGTTQHLTLDKPVPVYVGYWTAVPDESGAIGFVPDLYGLDEKVLAAMRQNAQTKQRVVAATRTECSQT